jgi:hypothetical protein
VSLQSFGNGFDKGFGNGLGFSNNVGKGFGSGLAMASFGNGLGNVFFDAPW